jgi:hypothetical protein
MSSFETVSPDGAFCFSSLPVASLDLISLEEEMIVPQSAVDDLGQETKTTAEFLR